MKLLQAMLTKQYFSFTFSCSGFMDALSDPKGYLSAQEKEQAKRAEQLAKIGIDENEIDTSNVILGKGNSVYIVLIISLKIKLETVIENKEFFKIFHIL